MTPLFQWTFEIKDLVNFEGTQITIYAQTYREALRKCRDLKLPQLQTFESIEDGLKLVQVYEVDEFGTFDDEPQETPTE